MEVEESSTLFYGKWVSYIYGKDSKACSEFFIRKSIISSNGNPLPKKIELVSPATWKKRIFLQKGNIWSTLHTFQNWEDQFGGYCNGRMHPYEQEDGLMRLHIMLDK